MVVMASNVATTHATSNNAIVPHNLKSPACTATRKMQCQAKTQFNSHNKGAIVHNNKEDIAHNREAIASNKEDTAHNREVIASNKGAIAHNTEAIASNKVATASNKVAIAHNKGEVIAHNKGDTAHSNNSACHKGHAHKCDSLHVPSPLSMRSLQWIPTCKYA